MLSGSERLVSFARIGSNNEKETQKPFQSVDLRLLSNSFEIGHHKGSSGSEMASFNVHQDASSPALDGRAAALLLWRLLLTRRRRRCRVVNRWHSANKCFVRITEASSAAPPPGHSPHQSSEIHFQPPNLPYQIIALVGANPMNSFE